MNTVSPAVCANDKSGRRVSWLSKGDDFEARVKDELPVLFRVARRMGCSIDEAEDVVQSTMLKAYRAWDRFDGQHLRSWLIKIMRNERLMSLRGRIDTNSLDETEAYEVPSEPFWAEANWRLQAEQLLAELEKLPEIYRMVIQLCDVEELSYEETADALDIPVGTVRSRLFRGRTMLRQRLEGVIDLATVRGSVS